MPVLHFNSFKNRNKKRYVENLYKNEATSHEAFKSTKYIPKIYSSQHADYAMLAHLLPKIQIII